MTMFRQYQDLQAQAVQIMDLLRQAILATSTPDMVRLSGEAQAIALTIQSELSQMSLPSRHADIIRAAATDVENAIAQAEKVALGTSVDTTRPYLLDFKTYTDFTYAYLTVAMGLEEQ